MSQFTEIVSLAGVTLGAIVAALALLVKLGGTAKRIDQAIGKDVQGKTLAERHEEQGAQLTAQAGMLQKMDTRLTAVESILSPPGQEPLPLRVRKVETEIDEVRNEVKQVGAKVDTLTLLVKKDIEGRE